MALLIINSYTLKNLYFTWNDIFPYYPIIYILNAHISNLRDLRVEINKAIELCRTKQIVGAALETQVNYLPESNKIRNSLKWLEDYGNKEVDLYNEWLIISNFQFNN